MLPNVFSRFAGKHLTITPAECTNCRLCENVCPYNAIIPSDVDQKREEPEKSRKQFITYFILIPLFAVTGAVVLYNVAPALAGINSNVRLAKEIRQEKKSGIESLAKDVIAFQESGKTETDLFKQEEAIIKQFQKAAPWAGIFLGISLGFGMVSLTVRRKRTGYKPDQGKCYSCGACFKYCPVKIKVNEV